MSRAANERAGHRQYGESRRRMVHRTRIARQIVAPTPENSANCFFFNGKRYCVGRPIGNAPTTTIA